MSGTSTLQYLIIGSPNFLNLVYEVLQNILQETQIKTEQFLIIIYCLSHATLLKYYF